MQKSDRLEFVKTIGSFLFHKRIQINLTVKELAAKTGLTEQAIARLESGRAQRIDFVKIALLSEYLDFTIRDLAEITELHSPEASQQTHRKPELLVHFRSLYLDRGLRLYTTFETEPISTPRLSNRKIDVVPTSFAFDLHVMIGSNDKDNESKVFCLNDSHYRQISIALENQRFLAHFLPNGVRDDWYTLSSPELSPFIWYHLLISGSQEYFRLWINQIEIDQIKLNSVVEHPLKGTLSLAHELHPDGAKANFPHRQFNGYIFKPTIWSKPIDAFQLKKYQANIF